MRMCGSEVCGSEGVVVRVCSSEGVVVCVCVVVMAW